MHYLSMCVLPLIRACGPPLLFTFSNLPNWIEVELTQKDFNRKMREYILFYLPCDDQHLGMTEMSEKYPEKIAEIKGTL